MENVKRFIPLMVQGNFVLFFLEEFEQKKQTDFMSTAYTRLGNAV